MTQSFHVMIICHYWIGEYDRVPPVFRSGAFVLLFYVNYMLR